MSAEAINNYSENSTILVSGYAKVEVQDDNTSVIITYAAPKSQQSDYTLTISNIRNDKSTEIVTSKTFKINFLDITFPTVSSIILPGDASIMVTFSEPVNNANNASFYQIDGRNLYSYGLTNATYDDTISPSKQTVVFFTFGTKLPVGTHTFSVVDSKIADAANYFITASNTPINVIQDATKPTVVSSKSINLSTLNIEFNKAIQLPNLSDIYVNGVQLNNSALIKYKLSSNKTIIEITRTVLLVGGTNYISMAKSTVTDFFGNTNDTAEIRLTVDAIPDTTLPMVLSVSSTNEKTISVGYSKAMDVSATNKANYTLKNSSGNIIGTIISITKIPGQDSFYNINFSTALPMGTYILTISGVKDYANNSMATATNTLTIVDTTQPLPPTAILIDYTYKRVKVSFSEAMDLTTITNKANYQLSLLGGTSINNYIELDPGVVITPEAENKSVILDFPDTTQINTNLSALRTVMLKDLSGNYTKAVSDFPIVISGVTALTPKFLRARAIGSNQLEVEYNNQLSVVEANDFYYNNIPAQMASIQNLKVYSSDNTTLIDGAKITLTFPTSIIDTVATGALSTSGPIGTMDLFSNPIDIGILSSSGTIVDNIAPKIISASIINSTTVEITFSENMQSGLGLLFKNDFTVTNGGSYVQIDLTVVVGNKVRLTLNTPLDLNQSSLVIPKASIEYVQDLNANLYVPSSTDLYGISLR